MACIRHHAACLYALIFTGHIQSWAHGQELVDHAALTRAWHSQLSSAHSSMRAGNFKDAEFRYAQALSIAERLGDSQGRLSESIRCLADCLFRKKRIAESEQLYRKALALREKSVGKEHQQLDPLISQLVVIDQQKGELSEARTLLNRLLAIRISGAGPDAPIVAETKKKIRELDSSRIKAPGATRASGNLSVMLSQDPALKGWGRLDKEVSKLVAQPARQVTARMQSPAGLPTSPISSLLSNVNQCEKRRDYEAAADALLSFLQKSKPPRIAREDELVLTNCLQQQAQNLISRKGYRKAAALLSHEVSLRSKLTGSNTAAFAQALHYLAYCTYIQKDYSAAMKLSERALAIRDRLGVTGPEVSVNLEVLAEIYRAAGKLDRSIATYRRAVANESKYFRSDRDLGIAQYYLASRLSDKQRYNEAVSVFSEAARHLTKVPSETNLLTRIYSQQASDLMHLGRYQDATNVLSKASKLAPNDEKIAAQLESIEQLKTSIIHSDRQTRNR